MKKNQKMTRLLIAFGVVLFLLTSCSSSRGSRQKVASKPLPIPELFSILDSIVEEGWHLYYSERANWVASDLVMEKYRAEDIGGSVSWESSDSVWHVSFFDKEEQNCILEYQYDLKSNKPNTSYSIRPITSVERTNKAIKDSLISSALNLYGDSLLFADSKFGSPNIDVVHINDKLIRLYFLQGTFIPDVIPFGNDYSVDFDENLRPLAFRRYHHSLIAMKTKREDGKIVVSNIHSHLQDNPFITPTDICNFLLYRSKNMSDFRVYSTVYGCQFSYSYGSNKIITVTE